MIECDTLHKIIQIIVPQYMNITTKFSTLKLLFFSFSSCLTIFIRNTRTSSSINENSEFCKKFKNFKNDWGNSIKMPMRQYSDL